MTTVDLEVLQKSEAARWPAIKWLLQKYGPAGGTWKLRDLRYIEFNNEKEAVHFILRWS